MPDTSAAARPPGGPSLRARLMLLVVSLIVAAVLGEAMVRVARPGFPGFRVPQVDHRPVPGLGFEMIPNQVAYSNASRVTINSAGFRGPEIRDLAEAGYPRVLCLGDSMTMGVAVEDDETYAAQLQRLLEDHPEARDPEVINAGVQRYFTFQEIDLLEINAGTLRPDVVTLAVYANDLGVRPDEDYVREFRNEREIAATAFRNRFPRTYLLAKNSAFIELSKSAYLAYRASRRPGQNVVQHALEGRITERDEPKWQGVEQELVAFRDLARVHRFAPIVVFVPVRRQIQQDLPESLYPRRLADFARGLGLPVIDPAGAFKESLRSGVDPYLPWDDHMSVAGHRLVAEAIARELHEGGWSERSHR